MNNRFLPLLLLTTLFVVSIASALGLSFSATNISIYLPGHFPSSTTEVFDYQVIATDNHVHVAWDEAAPNSDSTSFLYYRRLSDGATITRSVGVVEDYRLVVEENSADDVCLAWSQGNSTHIWFSSSDTTWSTADMGGTLPAFQCYGADNTVLATYNSIYAWPIGQSATLLGGRTSLEFGDISRRDYQGHTYLIYENDNDAIFIWSSQSGSSVEIPNITSEMYVTAWEVDTQGHMYAVVLTADGGAGSICRLWQSADNSFETFDTCSSYRLRRDLVGAVHLWERNSSSTAITSRNLTVSTPAQTFDLGINLYNQPLAKATIGNSEYSFYRQNGELVQIVLPELSKTVLATDVAANVVVRVTDNNTLQIAGLNGAKDALRIVDPSSAVDHTVALPIVSDAVTWQFNAVGDLAVLLEGNATGQRVWHGSWEAPQSGQLHTITTSLLGNPLQQLSLGNDGEPIVGLRPTASSGPANGHELKYWTPTGGVEGIDCCIKADQFIEDLVVKHDRLGNTPHIVWQQTQDKEFSFSGTDLYAASAESQSPTAVTVLELPPTNDGQKLPLVALSVALLFLSTGSIFWQRRR